MTKALELGELANFTSVNTAGNTVSFDTALSASLDSTTVGGNTALTLRTYSDDMAANAFANATSYSDTVAATAYSNATSYSDTVAATAYSNATSYSDTVAATAYSNAVSDATNLAANAYANVFNGGTFSGNVVFTSNVTANTVRLNGNMQIDGDLIVSGNTVTMNVSSLAVEDNMIYLNASSNVAEPDIGIAGNYNDGTYRHTGVFRDATDGIWKFFHQYEPEPDASAYIDTANNTFALANVQANTFIGALSGNASISAGNTVVSGTLAANTTTITGNLTITGDTTVTGAQFVNGAVTFANSTTNTVFFVANGNVGIGNSTPNTTFVVKGSVTTALPLVSVQASGNAQYLRGVSVLNDTMSSGAGMMYSIGHSDTWRNQGQFTYHYAGANSTSSRVSIGLHSVDDLLNIWGSDVVSISNTTPLSTNKLTVQGNGWFSNGIAVEGKLTSKQLQINRSANNAAIWWADSSDLDTNHVLWNDYFGGPLTKGAAGSGFDGMKWNTYKGIHIRTGSTGQYNSLIVSGSGASTNDHQVYLYGANDEKLRTVTDDGITIQRDLYITGSTGGSYANRLIIGGTSTPYTIQDTNLRPTLYMTGGYPVITLNTDTTQNANHGGTLQFTCSGTGSQFVIGTNGTGTMLSMGYSSTTDWNPHNGISGYSGTSFFQAGSDGYIGIGSNGDWTVSGGSGTSVPGYNLHFIGKTNGTNGHAALFRNDGSGAGSNGNGAGFCFVHTYGDHSWGVVSEFRVDQGGSYDKPSILFSNGADSNTWTCGYGYYDTGYFRINIDHGHRNASWGTTRFQLDRSGNLTIGGTLTQNSDERIKYNVASITNALDKVLRLNGVTFNYIDDDRPGIGLIAQNVEEVQPEFVSEVPSPVNGKLETYKSVSYANMVSLLIEAIKELNVKIETLKA